ncbi:recombinase family protein [Promicromonospora alba]|uniref:Recombinase family protein n=1 Tax=Promicromonospora alba TaxID=1616110 RepID=A0ABV9HPJ6_9MICO
MDTRTRPRVAIYLRQSITKDDSYSFEIQEAACRELADREGWQVVDIFQEAKSTSASKGGKGNAAKRPELVAFREAYDRDEFDFGLVHETARLARNMADGAQIVSDMYYASVLDGVRYLDEDSDDFSPLLNMLLAHKFAKDIGKRWREAHKRRFLLGLPPTGGHQYGYVQEKGAYLPGPDAPKLTEAYRRFINGAGFRVVAEVMGVDIRVARRALDSGFGAGLFLWQKKHWSGAHTAVITHGEWQAYLKVRAERADIPTRSRNPKYWLSGVAHCGKCGATMVRNGRGMRCTAYVTRGKSVCSGTWGDLKKIERKAWMYLGAHSKEWAAAMPAFEDEEQRANAALLDATAERDAAQEQLDGAVKRVLLGVVTEQEAAPILAELRASVSEAQEKMNAAEAALAMARPADDWSAILRVVGYNDEEGDIFDELEPEEWNAVLKRLMRITVYNYEHIEIGPATA